MSTTLPDILTIQETGQYLRIPLRTMYKLAQEGKIPCQKIGRHWRFRKAALDKWLDEIKVLQEPQNQGLPGRDSAPVFET